MVSALDSGSNSPGLSLGLSTAMCSQARHFTLIMPLFTQVYKWVLANLLLGVILQWTSIPSRGEQKYSQPLHATGNGLSSGTDGLFGLYTNFNYLPLSIYGSVLKVNGLIIRLWFTLYIWESAQYAMPPVSFQF